MSTVTLDQPSTCDTQPDPGHRTEPAPESGRLAAARDEYHTAADELVTLRARHERLRRRIYHLIGRAESLELQEELAERRLAQAETWLGRVAHPSLAYTDAYRVVLGAEGKLERGEPL